MPYYEIYSCPECLSEKGKELIIELGGNHRQICNEQGITIGMICDKFFQCVSCKRIFVE